MRILVITRSPWSNNNGIGNTMSQFFSKLSDAEIHNLYFREEVSQNSVCSSAFCISEGQIVRALLKRTPCGKQLSNTENNQDDIKKEKVLYNICKRVYFIFPMFVREWLWSTGVWKNNNLKRYLSDIRPDIIFMPVFPCWYAHKVLVAIQKMCRAKVVLFHADDVYSLKQWHFSPLYWIYRFILRKWVRRSVDISEINYTISEFQKQAYEKSFKKSFKILTKFSDFNKTPTLKNKYNTPLQLVFTGNIYLNRWKSLGHIVRVLEKINADGVKAQLRIYTGNSLTSKMKKVLESKGTSFIMGSVPSSEIVGIQNEADILVHVEAMDKRNKLCVRMSFSTKIVDYMASSRPILAYGPRDVASINHLWKNNCAIVVDNEEDLYENLSCIIDTPQKLNEYVNRTFEFGKKYHNEENILKMLQDDLNALAFEHINNKNDDKCI